jgi:hypothetical protein
MGTSTLQLKYNKVVKSYNNYMQASSASSLFIVAPEPVKATSLLYLHF